MKSTLNRTFKFMDSDTFLLAINYLQWLAPKILSEYEKSEGLRRAAPYNGAV